MSRFDGRSKLPQFLFVALGMATKLAAALALLVVLLNYFALDIRLSHRRPMIDVQVIVLDNLPHGSISGILKFAGDFLGSLR